MFGTKKLLEFAAVLFVLNLNPMGKEGLEGEESDIISQKKQEHAHLCRSQITPRQVFESNSFPLARTVLFYTVAQFSSGNFWDVWLETIGWRDLGGNDLSFYLGNLSLCCFFTFPKKLCSGQLNSTLLDLIH